MYTWQDINESSLVNTASISLHDAHLTAHGTQRCNRYRATWELTTSPGWITRSVQVQVAGEGWERSLDLRRGNDGTWVDKVSLSGTPPTDLAAPGIGAGVDLTRALDVDLGLCPVTNTMPIRRLGLLEGTVPRTGLLMAWVDMPSLRVIASDQYYASVDGSSVSYVSGTREVDVVLGVDADGVVVDYPGLAQRISRSFASLRPNSPDSCGADRTRS